MIKNYGFNTIDNIKYLFILFLSFNFALSLLIFFQLLSYKVCIAIFLLFYLYLFILLLINFQKNIHNLYFVIFFLIYWLIFFVPGINAHDDLSSYLVFAEKFIDRGIIPEETLSIRRSYSLGGSFLFKGLLSKFNPNSLSFFEPILGMILISILILSSNTNFSKKFLCLSILMFCPFLGSKIILNTEPVFIMAFFSLAIMLLVNDYKTKRNDSNVGLLIFFVSIPLLYRPTTFLFNLLILVYFIYHLLRINQNKILTLSIIFSKKNILIYGIILIIFYPFILSSIKSSGTLMYPILGKGWQNESLIFSDYPLNYYSSIKNFEDIVYFIKNFFLNNFFFPVIVIFGISLYLKEKNNIYLIIIICFFLNCLAISFSIGVGWVLRYSFPVSLSILLFFIISQKKIFSVNKTVLHISYISLIILGLIVYFMVGKNVNSKRNKSMHLGYNENLISQIGQLKSHIDPSDRLLVNSIFSLAIYKSGFNNIAIYDTPLVMQPWIKKDNIDLNSFDKFEKEFVKYYKSLNIDYFITDHIVHKNAGRFDKLLSNNFELEFKKDLDTPNDNKELKLFIYRIKNE